ncbi:metalloregulator ArsR/SmtB family transcription factor [Martelella sp. HB161492]|uniref:ArsR/SmtB family transcription factor n=1 Tax=Martelella sp. HB161492 TaxID=2720726 RepID=UPI00159132FF|nr:metalloregulator ArsR/SmtB family transcription factor [Martelella sp. HB161492]
MSDFNLKFYQDLSEHAKALANAHRLLLLDHLGQGERSVERLAEISGLSVANTSQHLQQLRRSGFVQSRRDGKHVLYRLAEGPVMDVIQAMRHYAAFQRALQDDLRQDSIASPETLEAISRDALIELLNTGSVTLLDVRPEEEYRLGHLPGATNIPVADLAHRIAELDTGRQVIAYCRGPYCVLSSQAALLLARQGFHVRRFPDGVAEWQAAGLPTE